VSPDNVPAVELPLAKAVEKVLSSMQAVLEKTMKARYEELVKWGERPEASTSGAEGVDGADGEGKRKYLAETKAAEIRLVRNTIHLLEPKDRYKAEALEV
jgi:pyridoxine kinase